MNVYFFFFETVRYTYWHITGILTKFALRALHSILNFPLGSIDLYIEPTKNKSFWAATFVASRKFKYEIVKKVSTFFLESIHWYKRTLNLLIDFYIKMHILISLIIEISWAYQINPHQLFKQMKVAKLPINLLFAQIDDN